MNKWRGVIIDDQQSAIDHIMEEVKDLPFVEIIGTFTNHRAGAQFLHVNPVDFIILDVELENTNAFRFLASLSNPKIPTILYTAYDKYEDEGYDRAFVDVLLKPVSRSRLLGALRRLDTELKALLPVTDNALEGYYEYFQVKGPVRFQRQIVWFKDLVYADMQNGKLYLHLQDGTSLETNSTFGRIMELLPTKWFMECAKGVVFNINFYKGVLDGAVVLTAMKKGGEDNLTLPRGNRQAFPDFFAFVDSNIL